MAVDLGSTFRFTARFFDAAGNPADAGTVTITITLPDATTATPSVTNPSIGVYHADFVTTLIGRHLAQAVGTNDFAYGPDTFHVRDTAGEIIGLAEAKEQLNDASDADNEEIRDYLSAATRVVEHLAGSVVRRTVTERHSGGRCRIVLKRRPVAAVTSVTEEGTALSSSDYDLDANAGILTRISGSSPFAFTAGFRNVTVVYQPGREQTPESIVLAARMLVQHWWATQRQGANMPRLSGDEVLTIPGVAWSVPIRVSQLLNPERSPMVA